MLDFEWDDRKAAGNVAKHRVSFSEAVKVFDDLFAVHLGDQSMDYGEERFLAIGLVNGIVLSVVYAERDDRIRVISARRATKQEQKVYDTQRANW